MLLPQKLAFYATPHQWHLHFAARRADAPLHQAQRLYASTTSSLQREPHGNVRSATTLRVKMGAGQTC